MTEQENRPVAVITGAARGIGAAIALELATTGWDLVLGDIADANGLEGLTYALGTQDDLDDTGELCRAAGASVTTVVCDVRKKEDVIALVERAGPRLQAAIAVAGIIATDGWAWEQSIESFELDLAVNLFGVVNLAQAAIPIFLASSVPTQCRFVAVTSSAGERGLPQLASYVAAKHAAEGFVKSLAADLGSTGITANTVLPGSTKTQLLNRTARAYDLVSAEGFAQNQRLGRLLEPSEIASAVAWLCSPAASGTTGLSLKVDGGFHG
jgi:SDR family mycofactocin-dependent oxidoreductase